MNIPRISQPINGTSSGGLILILSAFLIYSNLKAQYISGFGEAVQGESIRYESHQPDAGKALLVRSLDREKFIEWYTDPLPQNFIGDTAEFLLIAGIDVNAEDNHSFVMDVGDLCQFKFRNPYDTLNKDWELLGDQGITMKLKGMMIDKYGDLFGYLFLSVPTALIQDGNPLKIRVTGESADSRSWFMVFEYNASNRVRFIPEQAIKRTPTGNKQLVRLDVLHFDRPADIFVRLGPVTATFPVKTGHNLFRIELPAVQKPNTMIAKVALGETVIAKEEVSVEPVRQKTLYLLPHSHHDIGYTHVQEEVASIQRQNIREAIRLSYHTKDYPEGAQFKWNSEVTWSVKNYIESCSEEEKEEFNKAVKEGWFEINGLYANIMTGLCRPEEMFRMMETGSKFARETGIPVRSAMISDIPGYPWSLVTVMAQTGIRYFSVGTNTFHRIGTILKTWGDQPFYWESASGKEKILCWIHGKGYSEFHTGLAYTKLRNKLKEQLIFDYLNELEEENYPYDILTMRYNIGSDNGPPDPHLSDIVRQWNETYASPKIVISTVTESFQRFEDQYGESLPVYRGDLTGYWEDGAASTAHHTAMSRRAAERLTQASKLYALYNPQKYPEQLFDQAWEYVLLFSEHTWGSWNSISDPYNPFTIQQWNTKKSFAEKADSLSKLLLNLAISDPSGNSKQLAVYNTNSWQQSGIVTVPSALSGQKIQILDEGGALVPMQENSSGDQIFFVENIPPFGNKKYYVQRINNEVSHPPKDLSASSPGIDPRLSIDPVTGSITSLKTRDLSMELIGPDMGSGLNAYLYVAGRKPGNLHGVDSISIRIKEEGPLFSTVEITSRAPGTAGLTREITLYSFTDRIDIRNTLDKADILEPEGVHFAFPFGLQNGIVRVSNAWNHYIVEQEQLPGSNKNYFSVCRWVDVMGDSSGITFIPLDAPMIELEEIRCDATEYGWVDSMPPTSTILSYAMNNYWETNYKASQEGETVFSYALYPQRSFEPLEAEKRALSCFQPLVATTTGSPSNQHNNQLAKILPTNVLVEQIIPISEEGFLVRLYNPSLDDIEVSFNSAKHKKYLYFCDPEGMNRQPASLRFTMIARDVMHLFIERSIEESTN
jgi:hypothetical protein